MTEKTHIDQLIGCSVFGVSLISRPSARVRAGLVKVQDAIEAALPGGVAYRTPAESLHMSIFQFVSVRDPNPKGSMDWQVRQNSVVNAIDEIASDPSDILLAAPRLELRPAAIILTYPFSKELEALRHRLEVSPSLSGLNSRRPGLQHVSLFRYSTEMSLKPLRHACQEIECSVPEWSMVQMDLVCEIVYPSLRLELLQSFRLAEAPLHDVSIPS